MDPFGGKKTHLPMEAAAQLAKSEDGKRLLQYLQQTQGEHLESAIRQAAAGNYDAARAAISALMADPQAKALLDKIGGK